MNFFAALTCTIFAWGLAEGSKVFLRNFQSVEAIFHRTRRTHSNDRFDTPSYVLLPLRGVLLVSFDTLSTKQTAFMCSVGALHGWCTSWSVHLRQVHPLELMHCLFGRCTPCSGRRQSRAETSAPLKYHRKTTNISEIIRNFAASIVESKLLDFCNTEAS